MWSLNVILGLLKDVDFVVVVVAIVVVHVVFFVVTLPGYIIFSCGFMSNPTTVLRLCFVVVGVVTKRLSSILYTIYIFIYIYNYLKKKTKKKYDLSTE